MANLNEKFVVDGQGNRIGVFLDIQDYQTYLKAFEELQAIRAYDLAKSSNDEIVPFEQAVSEIERSRK